MSFFGAKRILGAAAALSINLLALGGMASAFSGTVTLEGQKVFNGGDLSDGQFSFQLRKSGSETVLQTVTNDAQGNIVFENVPYSDEDIKGGKYITYEITEVPGNDSSIVYDNNVGYAILELEEGTGEIGEIYYSKPITEDISYDFYEYPVYHASTSELQGVAYSVFDSRDGSLTFFRGREGAYTDGQYVYLTENGEKSSSITDNYLYYSVVDETREDYNGSSADTYILSGYVKSVVFKDAVRPKSINFRYFHNCESYDLKKLDTSLMTNMSYMFFRNEKLGSINISSFDTSNVTTMESMFEGDNELMRIIFGFLETSRVKNVGLFAQDTKLEYFDLSRFDSTSLTTAMSMFHGSGNNTVTMQKLDFSTWKENGHYEDNERVTTYDSATIASGFQGEYLDISTWKTTYSAEFYNLSRVKVLKVCLNGNDAARGSVFGRYDYVNIATGETVNGSNVSTADGEYCGTYVKLGETSMDFVNRKKASISVRKVDDEDKYLPGAKLGLEMDGSIIYTWVTGDSMKTFGDLAYGHDYRVVELEAPAGYKKGEAVEFSVSNEGVVTSGNQTVTSVTLENIPDIIRVQKVWEDRGADRYRPESVTFEVRRVFDGEKIGEFELDNGATTGGNVWGGSFADFERYGKDGFEHAFKVVETGLSSNYDTTYSLQGSTETSDEPVVGDNVVITNEFVGELVDYSFEKRWDDNGAVAERPEKVVFKIYEEGDLENALGEVELTADDASEDDENVWEGAFEGLLLLNDHGTKAKYVIVEDAVDGYETSYSYDKDVEYADGDYVDALEISCNFGQVGGGFYGPFMDGTDIMGDNIAVYISGAANDTKQYLSLADDINYDFAMTHGESCTGRVVYVSEDKLTHWQQGTQTKTFYDGLMENATVVEFVDGVFESEATADPRVVHVNSAELLRDNAPGESSTPFGGANVVTNKKIVEEENVDTGEKVALSVCVFALSLAGVAEFRFVRKRY